MKIKFLYFILGISLLISCNNSSNAVSQKNWYEDYSIISHSGGGINGKIYTDSLEAWNYSYINGNRIFDADLNFTSDKVLVLRHEWSDDLEQTDCGNGIVPDYETFIKSKIFGKYTPMDAKMMFNFLDEHKDCFAACDTKNDTRETYEALVFVAKQLKKEHLLKRIIVSFYTSKDFTAAKNVYGFKNYAVRQYPNYHWDYPTLAFFCKENKIPVCMVWKTYLKESDDYKILLENNIKVWTAVVDEISEAEELQKKGVTGFVSNFIYEKDLVK